MANYNKAAAKTATKKYKVYISALQYGSVTVDAASEEEAEMLARERYKNGEVDWHGDELTDATIGESIEPAETTTPPQNIIDSLRSYFPVGCRVKLLSMDDEQAPPAGTLGTVRCIDDIGTIHVAWGYR